MSRLATSALSDGAAAAAAPEALSLLQRRLLMAEQEAEALIRDMGALGVSRDQIVGSAERVQRPVSPLKVRRGLWDDDDGVLWQRCDSLVSRLCRVESLLQTLKLTVFRLETERQLDPSDTANLKQQLAELQRESEEEQRASRREVMVLRERLQQAHQQRDDARAEVQRLGETMEAAAAAKMDMALAAEELKIVKVEMSQKLIDMREQVRLESDRRADIMKAHGELLKRAEDMERALEMERRHALLLRSDCEALHVEVQTGRQQVKEERERGRQLETQCQRLKEQTETKNSVVFELKTELKRQHTENNELLKEGRELRTAADTVQNLNKQLQGRCSQLRSALRSLTVENEKLQASLKAERNHVVNQLQGKERLLLEAARRNTQTELQGALTHRVSLQVELDKLRGEHAELLQSSSTAQETAIAQRAQLEQTIEMLRGELRKAKKGEEAMRKDLEDSKKELCLIVTKLEGEKESLETQLSKAKLEAGSLKSVLQSQQDENRRIMGKVADVEQQQDAVQLLNHLLKDLNDKNKPASVTEKLRIGEPGDLHGVGQTLENILASHTRLQLHSQSLQQDQEPATLNKDWLQVHGEIWKHQAEVEKLQRHLTSTLSMNNRAQESMQKALDEARADNKRLTHSLNQAVSTNSSLHTKLERARDQYQASIRQRDEQLREARTNITHLSEELRRREGYESSVKTLHREISELKETIKDSATGSGGLSRANQDLRQEVGHMSRDLQDNYKKAEGFEDNIRNLREEEEAEGKRQEIRMHSQQASGKQNAEWERWTSTIQRWEAKRNLAHVSGGTKPVRTQLKTQSYIRDQQHT